MHNSVFIWNSFTSGHLINVLQTRAKLKTQTNFYVMHRGLGMTDVARVEGDIYTAVCNIRSHDGLFLDDVCRRKIYDETHQNRGLVGTVTHSVCLSSWRLVFTVSWNTTGLSLFTHNSVLCVILFLSHPRLRHLNVSSLSPLLPFPYSFQTSWHLLYDLLTFILIMLITDGILKSPTQIK